MDDFYVIDREMIPGPETLHGPYATRGEAEQRLLECACPADCDVVDATSMHNGPSSPPLRDD